MEKNGLITFKRRHNFTSRYHLKNPGNEHFSYSPIKFPHTQRYKLSRKIIFANDVAEAKTKFLPSTRSDNKSKKSFKDALSKIDNTLKMASSDLKLTIPDFLRKKIKPSVNSKSLKFAGSTFSLLNQVGERKKRNSRRNIKNFFVSKTEPRGRKSFKSGVNKTESQTPRVNKEGEVRALSLEVQRYLNKTPNELISKLSENNNKIKSIKRRMTQVDDEYDRVKGKSYPILRLSVRNIKGLILKEKMGVIDDKPKGIIQRLKDRTNFLKENKNLVDLNSKLRNRLKIKLKIFDEIKRKKSEMEEMTQFDDEMEEKETLYNNYLEAKGIMEKIKEEQRMIKEEKRAHGFEMKYLNKNVKRAQRKNEHLIKLKKQTKYMLDKSVWAKQHKIKHGKLTDVIVEIEDFLKNHNVKNSYRSSTVNPEELKKIGIDSLLVKTDENDATTNERFDSYSRSGEDGSDRRDKRQAVKDLNGGNTLVIPNSRYDNIKYDKAKRPKPNSRRVSRTPRFSIVHNSHKKNYPGYDSDSKSEGKSRRKDRYHPNESDFFSPSFSPSVDEDSKQKKKQNKPDMPRIRVSKVEHKAAPVARKNIYRHQRPGNLDDGLIYSSNDNNVFLPESLKSSNKSSKGGKSPHQNSTSIAAPLELYSPKRRLQTKYQTEMIQKSSISSVKDKEIREQNRFPEKLVRDLKNRRKRKLRTTNPMGRNPDLVLQKNDSLKKFNRSNRRFQTQIERQNQIKNQKKYLKIVEEIENNRNLDLKSYYTNSKVSRNSIDLSQLRSSANEDSFNEIKRHSKKKRSQPKQQPVIRRRVENNYPWDKVKMSLSDISKVEARDDPLNPQRVNKNSSIVMEEEESPENKKKVNWSLFKDDDILVGNESKKESLSNEYSSYIRTSTKKSSIATENNFIDFNALNSESRF